MSSAILGAAWWNHWAGSHTSWQGANHWSLFHALLCLVRSVMKARSSLNCFHDWCWVRSAEKSGSKAQLISSLFGRSKAGCIITVTECFRNKWNSGFNYRNLSNVVSTLKNLQLLTNELKMYIFGLDWTMQQQHRQYVKSRLHLHNHANYVIRLISESISRLQKIPWKTT